MSKKIIKAGSSEEVKAEPKFETALSNLEKIVEEMEAGKLSLEDALKRYEEGVSLARYCSKKLNEIQKKISLLKKDGQGQWTRKPFEEALEIPPAGQDS